MTLSNLDIYLRGQIEFVKCFKEYLKKHRDWDVEIEWVEPSHPNRDQIHVIVDVNVKTTLTLDNEDVETFGIPSEDKTYQTSILEKKARELLKKLQKNKQSHSKHKFPQ